MKLKRRLLFSPMDFCHYGLAGCGKRCCFLCSEKCSLACTLKCQRYYRYEKTLIIDNVIIHYAKKNQAPDPKWRDITGVLLITSRGKGPRNVLVKTNIGTVVVPRLNVRYLKTSDV